MQIFSEKFFFHYMFDPYSKELTKEEQKRALITSIAIAILTLGIVHLVCGVIRLVRASCCPVDEKKTKAIAQKTFSTTASGNSFIAFYKSGSTAYLGNFAICPNGLKLWGNKFRCAEAAFQWKKYDLAARDSGRQDLLNDLRRKEFFNCDGEQAFQLRKYFDAKYPGVFANGWLNGVRDKVMWETLQAKFSDNLQFKKQLKATKGKYLLEHNPVIGRDTYWSDDCNGNGKNMLGKQLMALRDAKPCPQPNENNDAALRIECAAASQNLGHHIF